MPGNDLSARIIIPCRHSVLSFFIVVFLILRIISHVSCSYTPRQEKFVREKGAGMKGEETETLCVSVRISWKATYRSPFYFSRSCNFQKMTEITRTFAHIVFPFLFNFKIKHENYLIRTFLNVYNQVSSVSKMVKSRAEGRHQEKQKMKGKKSSTHELLEYRWPCT